MLWLVLSFAFHITPDVVPQGQVARIKAASPAAAVRFGTRKIPLFAGADGSRSALLPIPALEPPGSKSLDLLDGSGKVLESMTITVKDARFRRQNIVLGKSLQELKPAPDEMETVAALRNTVSPERRWIEPFQPPIPGCMTSPFGVLRLHNGKPTGNYHSGIDQRGAEGVPIHAITEGTVKIVRKFNIHGDTVGIDHGQGVTSFYLHMSGFAVAEGETVKRGDVIGYVGSTGRSTAPHLHWALDVHGVPVNPAQWMEFKSCGSPPAPAKRRRR